MNPEQILKIKAGLARWRAEIVRLNLELYGQSGYAVASLDSIREIDNLTHYLSAQISPDTSGISKTKTQNSHDQSD
jgi:hypothetical protein